MRRRKNSDDTTRGLLAKLEREPGDQRTLRAVVQEMLRAGDHRGLVMLGPAAVPVLRELDGLEPGSLARRARVDIVRLELSILGRGASFTAAPIGTILSPTLWVSDGRFTHRADENPEAESVRAFPDSGGLGATIPLRDIIHLGDAARRAYRSASGGWRIASLGFDGEGVNGEFVEAWLFGTRVNGAHTWNGWARPFMTLDQARRFARLWNETPGAGESRFLVRERDDGTTVVAFRQGDEEYESLPEWVDGEGAPGEPVYDMSHGLVWTEEVEKDDEAEA